MIQYLRSLGVHPTKLAGKLLRTRAINSYTNTTVEAINAIAHALFPDILPVGSYIYRAQRYPGDIDLMETIRAPSKKAIRKIIQDVISKADGISFGLDTFIISDFKAGMDDRFIKLAASVSPYDYPRAKNELKGLKGAMSEDDYKGLSYMIKAKMTTLEINILKKYIHDKKILRWDPADVEDGKLGLYGGKTITLDRALGMPSIVKLDLIYWMAPRYVEITNFFKLFVVDSEGKDAELNVVNQNYIPDMKAEYVKYMFDPYYYNPFKALKRLWVITVIERDDHDCQHITNLMSSGYAILYQVIGDLDVLCTLYTFHAQPMANIFLEVDTMKNRLANIYEFDLPKDTYDNIDDILGDVAGGDPETVLKNIKAMIMALQNTMNREIKVWITKNNIKTRAKKYMS